MRLALVTTAPSVPSRVGASVRQLLPHLARRVECEVFVAPGTEGEELSGLRTRPSSQMRAREYDQVLYSVGNEAHQAFMVPLVRAIGGSVALHDWILFELALAVHPSLRAGGARGLVAALREGGLRQARAWWKCRGDSRALAGLRLPLNRSIVRFADAFLVSSEELGRRVLEDRNAPTPIAVVPRGAESAWRSEDRRIERGRLGLEGPWLEAFLVTSPIAGLRADEVAVLLEAVALARRSRPDVRLVLMGDRGAGADPREGIGRLGLEQAVRITGGLQAEPSRSWIHAADLALQLGAADAEHEGALQALALGRGVISAAPEGQGELPDECVYKLHAGEGASGRLAQKLVELRDSPAVRTAMEQAAREYIATECGWERVAALHAQALERFPRPRGARRSLIAMRLHEAARTGLERGRSG